MISAQQVAVLSVCAHPRYSSARDSRLGGVQLDESCCGCREYGSHHAWPPVGWVIAMTFCESKLLYSTATASLRGLFVTGKPFAKTPCPKDLQNVPSVAKVITKSLVCIAPPSPSSEGIPPRPPDPSYLPAGKPQSEPLGLPAAFCRRIYSRINQ